jgi:hypothetical protein
MLFAHDDRDAAFDDNSSVIESAEVFSPVFDGKIDYSVLKGAALSAAFKQLRSLADARPSAA